MTQVTSAAEYRIEEAFASQVVDRSSLQVGSAVCDNADEDRPIGVLVIDDEQLLLKTLEHGLRNRGFKVWVAAHGGEGAKLYRLLSGEIDLVLTDLQMPVLDGRLTLDALRAINPFVRCCFMTGDTRLSTLQDLLQRGALRVFAKPLPPMAEVAEELRELATRPHVSIDRELASEPLQLQGPGSATPSAKSSCARCFLRWLFSPFVRLSARPVAAPEGAAHSPVDVPRT